MRKGILFGLVLLAPIVVRAENKFDLLMTMLPAEGVEDDREAPLRERAREIAKRHQIRSQAYQRYGDVYRHYLTPNPDYSCLHQTSCFADYAAAIEAKQRDEFLRPDFSAAEEDLNLIADVLTKESLYTELTASLEQFVAKVREIKDVRWRGEASAPRQVLVFRSGHPLERRQELTIDLILTHYPKLVRVGYIDAQKYPEIFSLLGEHWNSAVLYGDVLAKDVVRFDQWTELLFLVSEPGERVSTLEAAPFFDAHEHVVPGGEKRWLEIMADNQVTKAVVAALPNDIHYAGLAEVNQWLLGFSREHRSTIIPFVHFPPEDPKSLSTLLQLHKQGARGVKLINGHGDYFYYNNQSVIDTPSLREIFAYCERKRLPVLWHVNTHIYNRGFFRALRDYPKLVVVNPHFGGYLSYAPELVRELFKRYPNLYFDISLGTQVMYLRRTMEDISLRNEEWRKIFNEFPDRFLFGVDMVVHKDTARSHARMLYRMYRDMLEKESYDFHFFDARGVNFLYENSHYHPGLKGLALPKEVLRKIYWENPNRLYGAR